MVADRDSAKRRKAASAGPARDNADKSAEKPAEKPKSRDLVPVTSKTADKPPVRSRLTDTLFLAHLFATRFQEPQTREKRRADPADANASYRKGAKKPARTGRFLSKKV